jgi:HEAT repeat protein
MSADNSRPIVVRRRALATLIVLLLLPTVAPAQPGGFLEPSELPSLSESVEQLRQQLAIPQPEEKTEWLAVLKKRAEAVQGVVDLSHALTLNEWRQPLGVGDTDHLKIRTALAERFRKAARDVLRGTDATRQCAAATLVAGLVPGGVHRGYPDPVVAGTITVLIPDVSLLAVSADRSVREAAARALGRFFLDTERAAPALGKLLGDREPAVRRAAAEALVSQAREGGPGQFPLAAWRAVGPVAAGGVPDEDERVGLSCLDAVRVTAKRVNSYLGEHTRGEPLPVLPGKPRPAGDANAPAAFWGEIRPVANALGQAVRLLLPLLASDNSARRVRGCQALEAIAATRARMVQAAGGAAPLARALGGKDPLLPGLTDAVADLIKCVGDTKDVEVRLAGLYVLEELGPEAAPAAAVTAKALGDDDSFMRWGAARVFGKMAPAGAAAAVPGLAVRVNDENGDVRITALAALERYGPAAAPAVTEVSQALNKGDEATRLWAVRVLAAVGPGGKAKTREPLIGALSARGVGIRRIATVALARFGKADKATTAALRAALADEDADVRRTASEALLK